MIKKLSRYAKAAPAAKAGKMARMMVKKVAVPKAIKRYAR